MEVIKKYEDLKEKISALMQKYEDGNPLVTDYEYDMLKQQLVQMEKRIRNW